jgi:hypothetical protein
MRLIKFFLMKRQNSNMMFIESDDSELDDFDDEDSIFDDSDDDELEFKLISEIFEIF